jgi:hypothetical protein
MSEFSLHEFNIPQQRVVDGKVFPICLTVNSKDESANNEQKFNKLVTWIDNNRDSLDQMLLEHKAILFRDCGISDAYKLDHVIQVTKYCAMDYVGGAAVRTQITERVLTANESPADANIPFHHEMAVS